VQAGDLPAWRARRIARATIALSPAAAGFVDAQVAGFGHRIRPSGVDRLVEEAIVRFMPEEARRRREAAADGRHVHVHTGQVSFEGTVWVQAEVDLADALDLDTALSVGAARLADLGSVASLDVRRSEALGEMARHQLSLDLDTGTEIRPARREVVLHVHLSEDAIAAPDSRLHLARVANTRSFVDAEQVRAWCRHPGTTVTVRPVIDLTEHLHVNQYEVPDRLAAQAAERDLACVFAWCTRPAESCDLDHVIPYSEGGSTSSDNIATLCRRHHRLKTHHSGWGYTVLEPGCYLWSSPHGYQFLRDHTGTTDVTHDRTSHPPDG
jgi:5-methylcytosine-specific restriction endonuclease McrA